MDAWKNICSFNPKSTNSLNRAAKENNHRSVKKLLEKINPNIVDNRGWTCLHEAAANDSYESLLLILNNPNCRPLVETHEGNTALHIACTYHSSFKIIKAILEHVEDIANYGCLQSVTPLHIESAEGRLDVVQLLLDHNAILDVVDSDGDTPLHDACSNNEIEVVNCLLHAGANVNIYNDKGFTAVHLASVSGSVELFNVLLPFIDVDVINQQTYEGETSLMLAVRSRQHDIVSFLLKNGANPNIINNKGHSALTIAVHLGDIYSIRTLSSVTSRDVVDEEIFIWACKSDMSFENFITTIDILVEADLLQHCFAKISDKSWIINFFIYNVDRLYSEYPDKIEEILYILLMCGIPIEGGLPEDDIFYDMELRKSPLLLVQTAVHSLCHYFVLKTLTEHGGEVDYTVSRISDDKTMLCDLYPIAKFSVIEAPSDSHRQQYVKGILLLLQYSLAQEPWAVMKQWHRPDWIGVPDDTLYQIAYLIYGDKLDQMMSGVQRSLLVSFLSCNVPPLKHLCRLQVRKRLREKYVFKGTNIFLKVVQRLPVPKVLHDYLRYIM